MDYVPDELWMIIDSLPPPEDRAPTRGPDCHGSTSRIGGTEIELFA
ncbi:MAG: hypothetical protein M3305_10940 [Actinomycetota bacterium]|nr:hypothetical protein [Actinomycetota bacterium]